MRFWLLGLVLLAACEENESKLDGFGPSPGPTAEETDWMAIEKRAAPIDAHLELLRAAADMRGYREADLPRRAELVIRWMDSGGTIPPPPLYAGTVGNDDLSILSALVIPSRPDDDRLFEAGLYLSAQWRRNGVGTLDESLARILVMKLMKLRPFAPAFADKYAPTDAEMIRTFAAEAMFARRATWEAEAEGRGLSDDGEYLQRHRELAGAPTDRVGFLAYLTRQAIIHPHGWSMHMLVQARRMFEHVDAYQRWLANRQTL